MTRSVRRGYSSSGRPSSPTLHLQQSEVLRFLRVSPCHTRLKVKRVGFVSVAKYKYPKNSVARSYTSKRFKLQQHKQRHWRLLRVSVLRLLLVVLPSQIRYGVEYLSGPLESTEPSTAYWDCLVFSVRAAYP